jgi:hypothetical protein
MRHPLRWIVLVLALLVVGGVAALGVVEQPKLDRRRESIDTRWEKLRPALQARYAKLGDALARFTDAGAGDRSVAEDLHGALDAWGRAVERADPAEEVAAANRLEAEGTRLRTNVLDSPRLNGVTDLVGALAAFDGGSPPPELVGAYNHAVERYQHERRTTLGTPVARVLGFDERPVLVVGIRT